MFQAIARIVYDANRAETGPTYLEAQERGLESYRAAVSAAGDILVALRHPTQEMIDAGLFKDDGASDLMEVWQAMVEAAIMGEVDDGTEH